MVAPTYNPNTGRLRWDDQEFKVILCYAASAKPAWVNEHETLSGKFISNIDVQAKHKKNLRAE